jgi:4-alpha-glucanotransferase
MNPKKSSTLYKELAEELNVPTDLVEDLIQVYYKNLRTELTGLTNPRINVEGLGQFVARPALVKKSIIRFKKILESHDTSTFRAYYNKKMLEDKVELLENLDEKLDEEKLKKETFKKTKNESSTKSNLGKQESNS